MNPEISVRESEKIEEVSVYLHWPFCLSKCPYCDFMSVPSKVDEELFKEYGALLLEDLQRSLEGIGRNFCIKTIFFGGGTPSLMDPEDIERIVAALRKYSEKHLCSEKSEKSLKEKKIIEISLEANPATFDESKLRAIKDAGVNRISLGVQSFSNDNLRFLGRIYDAEQALKSAEIVAKTFDNFSFDFIYGYEVQDMDSLKKDLQTAVDDFGCKHLSCYQLTFEERTPFYRRLQDGSIKAIGEKAEADLYKFVGDFLGENGFRRYEISNYALKGFECQHNLVYWNYGNYLGVGPAAHGRIRVYENFIGNCFCGSGGDSASISDYISEDSGKPTTRVFATEKIGDPKRWAEAVIGGSGAYSTCYELSEEEILEEMLIMRLRLAQKPLYMQELYANVSRNIVDTIITERKLSFLRQQQLIEEMKASDLEAIELTAAGVLHLNSIIEFLIANSYSTSPE